LRSWKKIKSEDSSRTIGRENRRFVDASLFQEKFRLHDKDLPLIVYKGGRNISSKNLRNDISKKPSIFSLADDRKRCKRVPDSLQGWKASEYREGDGDTRVEVSARSRCTDTDSKQNAKCVGKTDLEDTWYVNQAVNHAMSLNQ
jgi:hypothetical protein